jgi:hypothetical protein
MATSDKEIKLIIRAILDDAQFKTQMDKVSKGMDTTAKKATGLKKGLGDLKAGFFVAAAAVAGAVAALGSFISAAVESAKAQQKLNSAISNAGKSAAITADGAKKLATELMNLTTFEDEAVMGAEAMILRFDRIGSDIFPKVIESALDVAQALGIDATNAAELLGRALQAPEKASRMLRSMNIILTKSEEDQIKKMTDVNNIAGAQAIIMDKVSKSYGGMAKEAAGGVGKIQQLKNSIGEIKEVLGNELLRVLIRASDNLKKFTSNAEAVEKLRQSFVVLITIAQSIAFAFSTVQKVGTLMISTVMKQLVTSSVVLANFLNPKMTIAEKLDAAKFAFASMNKEIKKDTLETFSSIGTGGKAIADDFTQGMDKAYETVQNTIKRTVPIASSVIDELKELQDAYNGYVTEGLQTKIDKENELYNKALAFAKGKRNAS